MAWVLLRGVALSLIWRITGRPQGRLGFDLGGVGFTGLSFSLPLIAQA